MIRISETTLIAPLQGRMDFVLDSLVLLSPQVIIPDVVRVWSKEFREVLRQTNRGHLSLSDSMPVISRLLQVVREA